jgi:hypothetical protein
MRTVIYIGEDEFVRYSIKRAKMQAGIFIFAERKSAGDKICLKQRLFLATMALQMQRARH